MRAALRLALVASSTGCLGVGLLASPVEASSAHARTVPARTVPARTGPARTLPARTGPARTLPARTRPDSRGRPGARRPGGPTGIVAAGANLVNARTGAVLWSRGLRRERPIASLTKVMTAIVIIRAGHLDRKITVTQRAVTYAHEYDATSAGLRPGDVLTARQLLEGMLLPSGADAAYLLANAYGHGWRAFVRKMNVTARELGLTQTHFANFDGLPWPTERSTYSTPYDVVRLGEAAMKLPLFRRIVRLRQARIRATRWHQRYRWQNTDLLLGRYRGAIGIKTGFTHRGRLLPAVRGSARPP